MSDAKRHNSQFHHATAARRAHTRARSVAPELLPGPEWADLRVMEPWENRAVPSGDPYNGIGARAVAARALHK